MSVYIVNGAPGAGKSTYVEEKATSNDLVVDLDKIAAALHGGDGVSRAYGAIFPEVMDVRETLYNSVKRGGKWENAYIITTRNAAQIAEELNGEIVNIETPIEECKRRVMNDDTRQDKEMQMRLVDEWFTNRFDIPPNGGGNAGNLHAKAEVYTMSEMIQNNTPQAERTFTQAELNQIISERLARVEGKYADYETLKEKAAAFDAAEEAQKSELQKETERANALQAQLDTLNKAETQRKMREKVSAETNVPASLLTGADEETCKAQAAAILAFAQPNSYPDVRDGGEPHVTTGGKTRNQFADWFSQNI